MRLVPASSFAEELKVPSSPYSFLIRSTSGLAGYWRLDEASGTVADDTSGNAKAGVYVASPTLGVAGALTGDADKAVTLNGTTQCITLGDNFDFNGTASFSVELWVYPTTVDATERHLFSKEVTDGGGQQGWNITYSTSGITFQRWRDNAADSLNYATALTLNTWAQIVVTYDGTNQRLYKNGALVAGPTASAKSMLDTAGVATIGAKSGVSAATVGRMDEVSIYSSALSANTISSHYTTGTT